MKESWHKKVLIKEFKDQKTQLVLISIFTLSTLISGYFLGHTFIWEWKEWLSQPPVWYRLFYSAMVYSTLGAFLYYAGFYKELYAFLKPLPGAYDIYTLLKAILWLVLMGIMFFLIWLAITLINITVSIFYNILAFIFYIFPLLSISIALVIIWLIYKNKKK